MATNEQPRCEWCLGNELYINYHDTEWGVPVHDDRIHFEFLVLESAQAGLSWLTILKRREHYRRCYEGFDPVRVASFDQGKIERLLLDPGIIRNRKKIESSVSNAQLFLEIKKSYGSFDNYLWGFTDGKVIQNRFNSLTELPGQSALSANMSSDLKKRGFKFLGPTIMYAHLQSVGIVNDHLLHCFRHNEVAMIK